MAIDQRPIEEQLELTQRMLEDANAQVIRLQDQNNELTVSHVAIMGAMKRAYGVDIDCTVEQLAGAITRMEADLIVTRKAEVAYKAEIARLQLALMQIVTIANSSKEGTSYIKHMVDMFTIAEAALKSPTES